MDQEESHASRKCVTYYITHFRGRAAWHWGDTPGILRNLGWRPSDRASRRATIGLAALGKSDGTVKSQLGSVYRKLGVKNRIRLLVLFFRS